MQPLFSTVTHFIYTNCLKAIFFRFDPERVHESNVGLGKLIGKVPGGFSLTKWMWAYQHPVLHKKIDGMIFPNPIGLSAGFDYNADLTDILPAVGFGFHTIGTVTLKAYQGNTPPRLGRLPNSRSLLVNKGFKNIGARAIIKKLANKKFLVPTGISIGSTNQAYENEQTQIEDILSCFKLFEKSKLAHAYYELNISCPNTFGGEPFTTPAKLKKLVKKVDELQLQKPVYVKMPIDQSAAETLQLLKVLNTSTVKGVIFGNLTKDKSNPAVSAEDLKQWQQKKGNLSGKPTWERSNALVKLTRQHYPTRFTIIGTGGVFSGEDAQRKLDLGADLVQLITGMIFQGPQLIGQINRHLVESH